MDSRVKTLLEKHDIVSMNPERFREENHEMDNRILFHIFDVVHGYQWQDTVRMTGYTEHLAFCECNGPGLMFERDDGTEFWIHGLEDEFKFDLWNLYFEDELAKL